MSIRAISEEVRQVWRNQRQIQLGTPSCRSAPIILSQDELLLAMVWSARKWKLLYWILVPLGVWTVLITWDQRLGWAVLPWVILLPFEVVNAINERSRRVCLTNRRLIVIDWKWDSDWRIGFIRLVIREAALEVLSVLSVEEGHRLVVRSKDVPTVWTVLQVVQASGPSGPIAFSEGKNTNDPTLHDQITVVDRLREPGTLIEELNVLAKNEPWRELPLPRA